MLNTNKNAFSATKILVPLDFSPSSEAALEAATGLAQQFHAGIHLVHVIADSPNFSGSDFFPMTSVLEERRKMIEEKLEARKRQLMLRGVQTSFSIDTGHDIVGSLMRAIKRENTNMVVISTHGVSGWRPLMFGSIAEQVIKQVSCTLLLLQSVQHQVAVEEPAAEVWKNSLFPPFVETVQVGSTVADQLGMQIIDHVDYESTRTKLTSLDLRTSNAT